MREEEMREKEWSWKHNGKRYVKSNAVRKIKGMNSKVEKLREEGSWSKRDERQ